MNAVEFIYANLDTEKLLDELGFDARPSGDKFRAKCIMHDGISNTSFVIDEETGLWTCHGGCGSGSIFQLVMKIEELDFYHAMHWIAEKLGIDLNGKNISVTDTSFNKDLRKLKKLVQRLRREALEPFTYQVNTEPVREFRTFSEETLTHANMRTVDKFPFETREGKFFWTTPKYIFDLKLNNTVVGVALRRINEDEDIKWSYQPTTFRKKDFIFNYDEALAFCKKAAIRKIYVVEGIFDVMAFKQAGIHNVVSPLGVTISDYQRVLLMKLADDLVFAFDGDDAGRQAMLKASHQLKDFFRIKVILFEEGEDPESIEDLCEESKKAIPLYKWEAYIEEEKRNVKHSWSKQGRGNSYSREWSKRK